jgi:hypothetical protein
MRVIPLIFLKLEQVQRRFITRFIDSGSLQIQFGAGTAADTDEKLFLIQIM